MKKRLEALWCALFRVNKNATGYTWPICRILLCLLSYWLLTVVNGSRPMSTPRAVVFVLLIVLTWGLFYGVICALVEINIVRKHRRSPKTRQPVSGREKAAGKPFSLEQLAALAVNLADNIMLGRYSELALSGASLVNQLQFTLQPDCPRRVQLRLHAPEGFFR